MRLVDIWERTDNRIAELGGDPIEHGSAGNCLYNCVAHILRGDAARHSEIRQAVAHFIDANADSLENYLLEDDEYKLQGNPVRWENVAQYAAYVATDFSYCQSEIELISISELYRVQVCTKTHDQSHDKSYKPLGCNGETVELVHYVGTHYREFRKQGKEADGVKTQQGKKGKQAPQKGAAGAGAGAGDSSM